MSGIDLFLKGGPVMWILLVCSIICVSVGFERSRVYGKNKIKDLEELKKEIKKCLALKELEEAKRCCQQNQSFILSVALSGLQALEDQENVDTTLESVATFVAKKWARNAVRQFLPLGLNRYVRLNYTVVGAPTGKITAIVAADCEVA